MTAGRSAIDPGGLAVMFCSGPLGAVQVERLRRLYVDEGLSASAVGKAIRAQPQDGADQAAGCWGACASPRGARPAAG